MSDFGFWNVARATPDRLAVVAPGGERVSYGELHRRANQLVHALRARGLGRGDGIAILLPNGVEFLVAVLAANQAGMFYTPLNHNLVGAEISYILENSEAKAFIAHEKFAAAAIAAVAENAAEGLSCFSVGAIASFEPLAEVLTAQPTSEPEDRQAGSLMSYTSGTTGRPKGVRRGLSGLQPEQQDEIARSYNMLLLFGLEPGGNNAHFCISPLYHNAPGSWALFALQVGHTLVLADKFVPEEFLATVERESITSSHMVPIQFHRLLKLPDDVRSRHDLTSLRVVAHAGAPCPPEIKRQMIEWFGPVIYEYYSSSEGIGGTVVTPQEAIERPGTVGRPYQPGGVIKILDADGEEVPRGETGLVYSSLPGGAKAFQYFKDSAKTDGARQGDLFTAGDFGYMDEAGYLFLVSRRTDLILSGGVNIYPAEIENVLTEHPMVADVAVFGIPNPEWGEEVKAVVELGHGRSATDELADELLTFCRDRLASFKVPKSIDFVDHLPRDPNGKMYKHRLRDAYWTEASA